MKKLVSLAMLALVIGAQGVWAQVGFRLVDVQILGARKFVRVTINKIVPEATEPIKLLYEFDLDKNTITLEGKQVSITPEGTEHIVGVIAHLLQDLNNAVNEFDEEVAKPQDMKPLRGGF